MSCPLSFKHDGKQRGAKVSADKGMEPICMSSPPAAQWRPTHRQMKVGCISLHNHAQQSAHIHAHILALWSANVYIPFTMPFADNANSCALGAAIPTSKNLPLAKQVDERLIEGP